MKKQNFFRIIAKFPIKSSPENEIIPSAFPRYSIYRVCRYMLIFAFKNKLYFRVTQVNSHERKLI